MIATTIGRFRCIGMFEAVSFLVLLFVAMPLKHFYELPMAVTITGWIHGILFMLYCVALFQVHDDRHWKVGKTAIFFAAALIPFGPFIADGKLRHEEQSVA